MIQKLSKIIAPIITAVIFGIIATMMFTTIDVANKIDANFWTTTLIGTALTILTTLIWFPVGADNGKNQQNFKTVSAQYNRRADYIINNQLQGKLNNFCEEENKKFELKLLKNKLSEVCLTLDFFEKYKKFTIGLDIFEDKKDEEEFKKEIAKLTKKQIKVLEYLKDHKLKFKALTPGHILKAKNKTNRIVPVDSEKVFKTIIWTGKVLWSLCSFAVLAFIVVNPNTTSWLSKVFQLGIWACIIGFNIYSSLNNGTKSIVEYRKNDLLLLSNKCAEFFEYVNIPISVVDKVEDSEYEQAEELG